MPLNAKRKARRPIYPDGFDCTVFRSPFHDDAPARFFNSLTVQRIHVDLLAAIVPVGAAAVPAAC